MVASRNKRLAILACLIILRRRRRRNQVKKRRYWVRPWLARRQQLGAYDQLMVELENEDLPGYKAFQRVYPDLFREILEKVRPIIERQNTNMRLSIPAGVRLALTLRYLATGNNYLSHSFEFRVAPNTIGRIIPETCQALHDVLAPDYFKCPSTPEEWLDISTGFKRKWDFPNCLGAIDGKHVILRQPGNTCSVYFNYKHFFSIVLMAVVDSNYKFIFADIGVQGRVSDGGVWSATKLCRSLESKKMPLPPSAPLPGDDEPMPFVFLGDDAFPLRTYLMKPYPFKNLSDEQRIYNNRLSRARRVVENAFGILANRFRVFLQPMLITPERATKVVLAGICLHNLLRERYGTSAPALMDMEDVETHTVIEGAWRKEGVMEEMRSLRGNNATVKSKAQRKYLTEYFSSPVGAVPWQNNMI